MVLILKNAKNDQLFKLSHSKSDLHFNQLKSTSPKNPNLVEIGLMVVEKLKCAKVLSGRQTDAGQNVMAMTITILNRCIW